MLTDRTAHGEDTLFKVQAAITALGYSGQPVLDIISSIQSKGILFREPVPEGWLDKGPEPTETDPDLMPQTDAWTTRGSRIPSTLEGYQRRPVAAYNLGWQEGRDSVTSRTGEPEPDVKGWDEAPDPSFIGLPLNDEESEEQDASGLAVPELSQAEEPVEQRISRAFANGWREGFERAQWGTRWDHT